MKLKIISWHQSEKETKGLASVGLKHGDVFYPDLHGAGWVPLILEIYETGLNVMLAHSSEPGSIMVGVSDDLFKQR